MVHTETDISELSKIYPLPANWERPNVFQDKCSIGSTSISLCGISAIDEEGYAVTGSAAGFGVSPVERAYYELLERMAVREVQKKCPPFLSTVQYLSKNPKTNIEFSEAFPKSPIPQKWVYSNSNGVAIHSDGAKACLNALFELVERDSLLRSWYGGRHPTRLEGVSIGALGNFQDLYEFEFYQFDTPAHEFMGKHISVVAVFGWPLQKALPRVYGSASRFTMEGAVEGAITECLQGLGFLWGEPISDNLPDYSPTPLFHLEFYQVRRNFETIRNWLRGNRTHGQPKTKLPDFTTSLFVNITPRQYASKMTVVKAICPNAFPMFFGQADQFVDVGGKGDVLPLHPFS